MISPAVTGLADFIWSSVDAALVSGGGEAEAGAAIGAGFGAGAAAPVGPLSCGVGECGVSCRIAVATAAGQHFDLDDLKVRPRPHPEVHALHRHLVQQHDRDDVRATQGAHDCDLLFQRLVGDLGAGRLVAERVEQSRLRVA